MKKIKYLAVTAFALAALSTGAFAQQASATAPSLKADSAAAGQQVSQQTAQPALNKQASISRTTKKTNWSKIKTLFE